VAAGCRGDRDPQNPFLEDIVLAGLGLSDAVVVLATGDDLAQLRDAFARDDDEAVERELRAQPRANVIYEGRLSV
jgi:hypothetical protein